MNLSLPTPEAIIAYSICLGAACLILGALLGQSFEQEKREGTRDLSSALRDAYKESDALREEIYQIRLAARPQERTPLFDYEAHQ